MRVAIRMIGLATTFFWIFLIAFFVSAAYSVRDLHFSFEAPKVDMISADKLIVCLPISVANYGFYNVGSFAIETEIDNVDGLMLANGSSFVPVIGKDKTVRFLHNVSLNFTELLHNDQNYLFNDSEFVVHATIGMALAEVIPVQASTNFSVPWGAPLYNFVLSEVQYEPLNYTHLLITVPISFENHAFFDVVGDVHAYMRNGAGEVFGEGSLNVEAYSGTAYQGFLEFYVSVMEVSYSGDFEVYIHTEFFDYGPLVMPYG